MVSESFNGITHRIDEQVASSFGFLILYSVGKGRSEGVVPEGIFCISIAVSCNLLYLYISSCFLSIFLGTLLFSLQESLFIYWTRDRRAKHSHCKLPLRFLCYFPYNPKRVPETKGTKRRS